MKQHTYELQIQWTGNTGEGTKTYRSYTRDFTIASVGKPRLWDQAIPVFAATPPATTPKSFWSPPFLAVTC